MNPTNVAAQGIGWVKVSPSVAGMALNVVILMICSHHLIYYNMPLPNAVTCIDLMNSNLAGTLPSKLSRLDSSQYLNLAHGSIPMEFGEFLQLRFIDVGNNQLSGSIPTQVGNMRSLIAL